MTPSSDLTRGAACCDACKDVRMVPVRCAHCQKTIGEQPRDTASCDWNPLRLEAMRDEHTKVCPPYAAERFGKPTKTTAKRNRKRLQPRSRPPKPSE